MIKVFVPDVAGRKERQEGALKWVPVKPHVLSEYPIYPRGISNLDYGVQITRRRSNWKDSFVESNTVSISARGGTKVFIGEEEVTGIGPWGRKSLEGGIEITRYGPVQLSMNGKAKECELRVVRGKSEVAIAKLSIVTGEEKDELIAAERKLEARWVGEIAQGTSDFL